MTDEEIVVAFALTRLDNANSDLDLEDVAALVVRRLTPDQMLDLATRNLAERNELRGGAVRVRGRARPQDRPDRPGACRLTRPRHRQQAVHDPGQRLPTAGRSR
ncbi:hypothetical protein [Nocardia vaccinii]|uniref:hypothetical protein n=1 Tax=Nocardia vaccinii TaxID=1822 RepID=UPI000AF6ED2D|nr:hypothetical protein [Nocardia vaccinii]